MDASGNGRVPRSLKEAYEDEEWTKAVEKEVGTMKGDIVLHVVFRYTEKDDRLKKTRICARGDL